MFTPKKIGAGAARAAQYYTEEFHKEDYYAKGTEPPGKWVGGRSLGLDGELVRAEDLRSLFEGRDPSGKDLVMKSGPTHAPGWDMVFSAPKSVSVLWGTGDEKTRKSIEDAHEKAVKESLSFLGEHSLAGACRRGKNGVHRESPTDVVVATFQHGTSREHDPQLHTHALLLNVARRKDGSWGALQPDGVYRDVKLISALYRAELASELRARLGIAMERDEDALRIVGVSKEVERAFSKRRQAIEAEMAARGEAGLKADSAVAALKTRTRKQEKDRDQLYSEWREQALGLGFSPEVALEASRCTMREREKAASHERKSHREALNEELISNALSLVSEQHSTFTRHKLFERIALEAQETRSLREIRETFAQVSHARELVALDGKSRAGDDLYTTRATRTIEARLVENARTMASLRRTVSPLDDVLSRMDTEAHGRMAALSDEQRSVVRHVTDGKMLSLVQGWAGAGKSTTMAAARDVFEAQGAQVVGVAPTGKAAENLTHGSQIPATTIDAFLLSKGNALSKFEPGRGVLVVDEAAMVGSAKMDALLLIAKAREARVVLVGDSRQLSPIDAGAPFRVLEVQVGSLSLAEIRRQEILWQREAVKAFAEGRALEGLQAYRAAGRVVARETNAARDEALVSAWSTATVEKDTQALILATTNAHVKSLNEAAREQWKKAGRVRGKEHTFEVKLRDGTREERVFQKGDRLLFTKNDRDVGVKNGQFGTVEEISNRGQKSGAKVKVRLDEGREVSFNVGIYRHIEHGYASTVYKAQGSTIERVFVAHTPGMGRESSYVAMSRHRKDVALFVSKESFDAEGWKALHERPVRAAERQAALEAQLDLLVAKAAKAMERSQEKDMSVEYGLKGASRGVEALPVQTAKNERAQDNEVSTEKEAGQEAAKRRTRSRGFSRGM